MSEHLHRKLAALHESLLHGKLPRNLHWTDALELIGHLGRVQAHGHDEFEFVVGTRREVFKRPHTPELGVEDASRLRRLLKEAASEAPPSKAQPLHRLIVVIDHHAAHIFHDLGGIKTTDEDTIKPFDPHHFHHHLIHRKEAHYQGDRVPEETSFYEEVSKTLVPASEIVLIGHGTGKSRAIDVLIEYLKQHHPEVSQHVIAIETADLSALTEPQLQAIVRRHASRR
jgi:hypothetical protein